MIDGACYQNRNLSEILRALEATTSVRRPLTLKACRLRSVASRSSRSVPGRMRGSMTASEPLHRSRIVPSGRLFMENQLVERLE